MYTQKAEQFARLFYVQRNHAPFFFGCNDEKRANDIRPYGVVQGLVFVPVVTALYEVAYFVRRGDQWSPVALPCA